MEKAIGWPMQLYGDFKSANMALDQDQIEYSKLQKKK